MDNVSCNKEMKAEPQSEAIQKLFDQYQQGRGKKPTLSSVLFQPSTSRNKSRPHSGTVNIGKQTFKFYFITGIILMMLNLPQTTPKEIHQFMCKYMQYKEQCEKNLNETLKNFENQTFCPGFFDGYICWPHTPAGQLSTEPCPSYIEWRNESLVAYRFCEFDGSWMVRNDTGQSVQWVNRIQCDVATNGLQYELGPLEGGLQNNDIIDIVTKIYTAGYIFSLLCMVIALFILMFFKKLHCTRNYIHMNLMLSFIVRYVAVMVKDKVIEDHYAVGRPNLTQIEMSQYCDDVAGTDGLMVSCRLVITLMHYATIANYFWLLAEGVYLQLLLVFVMTEYKYFPIFMAFGWGATWIPIGVWIAFRITFENVGCWEVNNMIPIWWILRAPILISIAINFIIFINIIRMIVSKLSANNMTRSDYKYRLARSTLALIPLLGIHYIVFMGVSDSVTDNSAFINTKFAFEIILTSLQGSIIAILYCFLNGEVQTEIRKCWRNWRWSHRLPAASGKFSTYRSDVQMTSITYAHSIDKGDAHETSLLSPNNKHDLVDNKRSSTASCASDQQTQIGDSSRLMSNGNGSPSKQLVV
ncbi:glucagon-like peptide 1 receptor [Ciona intestinalis]